MVSLVSLFTKVRLGPGELSLLGKANSLLKEMCPALFCLTVFSLSF